MDLTIFISALFILQIVCFIASSRTAKENKTQDDYYLAGKGVRFFPLMMTFVATQVGGGLVLGATEEAYQYGWTVLLYPLGSCLGLVLLATGLGKRMAQFNVSTVAQLFEVVYKSRFLKKVASTLSIVSLFMIFVAQIIASKKFMVNVGLESNIMFIAFWGIVIIYTALGGLRAVVATDVIQASFFIATFLLCFFYSVYNASQSFSDVVSQGLVTEQFELSTAKLCGWLLMPLLFMVIEQDMGQRCFAAQSPKIVTKATAGAALCTMAVCMIPVYFGILGKNLSVEVDPGASVLMTVINAITNPAIAALVGCAILAAIISTADSLINAISSNLSQDFELSFVNVRTSQYLTTAIALIGIIFSFNFDNVVDLLIQSYELSVCCLFVPVFAALFKRNGNRLSATLAIVCGASGYFFMRFLPIEFPKEILSIFVSSIGFFAGEWISSVKKQTIAEQKAPG